MAAVFSDVLDADEHAAGGKGHGLKLDLFEQPIGRGERDGACKLPAPDAFTPSQCHVLAMLRRRAAVDEPGFDAGFFVDGATEELREALVLINGGATLIEHEDATGDAFEETTQSRFTLHEAFLGLHHGAELLLGTGELVFEFLDRLRWDDRRWRCGDLRCGWIKNRRRRWGGCRSRHQLRRNQDGEQARAAFV